LGGGIVKTGAIASLKQLIRSDKFHLRQIPTYFRVAASALSPHIAAWFFRASA
jgi:hypothetical protein